MTLRIPPRKKEEIRQQRQAALSVIGRILFKHTGSLGQLYPKLEERFTVKAHTWSQAASASTHLIGPRINHVEAVRIAVEETIRLEEDGDVQGQLQAIWESVDLACFERPTPAQIREWCEAEGVSASGESNPPVVLPPENAIAQRPPQPQGSGVGLLDLLGGGHPGQPVNLQVLQDGRGNAHIIKAQPGTEVVTQYGEDGETTIRIRPTKGDEE